MLYNISCITFIFFRKLWLSRQNSPTLGIIQNRLSPWEIEMEMSDLNSTNGNNGNNGSGGGEPLNPPAVQHSRPNQPIVGNMGQLFAFTLGGPAIAVFGIHLPQILSLLGIESDTKLLVFIMMNRGYLVSSIYCPLVLIGLSPYLRRSFRNNVRRVLFPCCFVRTAPI